MKLVWSPEIAEKALLGTVKSLKKSKVLEGSSVAELISAMAGGWNAKLIVETWSHGDATATSIGLAIARTHTSGRHICIVPDEDSKTAYTAAMKTVGMSPEVIVGEAEAAVKGMVIDFLVVDGRKRNSGRIVKEAKFGNRGAVVVCKNAGLMSATGFRFRGLVGGGSRRIVRAVYLPVGKGLDVVHVSGEGGSGREKVRKNRWIRRVDRNSGEEFVIRK